MYLLTELVRLMEQRGHVFPDNSEQLLALLRQTKGSDEERLHRRARILDREGSLKQCLETIGHRWNLLRRGVFLLFFLSGFLTAYGILQYSSQNFFFVLVSILGSNTLLLLWWLFSLRRNIVVPQVPSFVFGQNPDNIRAALAALYSEQAGKPYFMLRYNAFRQAWALAALAGMFAAMLLLLSVRQYYFDWQSTLWDESRFGLAVGALSWLPEKLGFPVPDAAAVAAARNGAAVADSAAWGGLLLGSMLCYGILPRLAAYLFCKWRVFRQPEVRLNLNFPYYQNIVRKLHTRITDDAGDYRPDAAPAVAVTLDLDADCLRWAVLLDAPQQDDNWFNGVLAQEWADKGKLSGRDETAQFEQMLLQHNVQLLVGVRAAQVPDRGTLRCLKRWSLAAKAGLVLVLLSEKSGLREGDGEIVRQWQDIAAEYGWLCLSNQSAA